MPQPPHNTKAAREPLRAWLAAQRRDARQWGDWRWQLRHALDAADLIRLGLLTTPADRRAATRYAVRLSPYWLSLANWEDPDDPILRQALPDGRELVTHEGERRDPFAESRRAPLPGVCHRFADRVLILATTACAMRCRHCTRKNTLGAPPDTTSAPALRAIIAYLGAHPRVREVILSGGDPLLLSDACLLRLITALAALPQLDAVRIGSRVPATLPMRVTPALARALGRSRKVWFNTQFNHASELTPEAAAACARLVDAGIPVSNQTVLLKGINDTADALFALCAGLQRRRVRPYYVFVGDPVSGTGHFRVTDRRARALARELAGRLGGLALPRFVADRPGAPAKQGL